MIKKQKNYFKKNTIKNSGILVLDNKTFFKGIGLGYDGTATGEVCFNTSLTGYQEIISDPSYAGQIINFTFPHIGNVGTNNEDLESDKIWTRGVIFNSEITDPSNYRSLKHLDQWLKKNKFIVGEHVTIADFSAYVEIAQLNKQFTNLFDYSEFKNLSRWLEDMSKLDHHDDVHMVLTKMGDISETVPEMEIIMKANLETFSHLNKIASNLS